MSKKREFQDHPKNPANQPFQLNGSRCASKTDSWWNPGSRNYWRSKKA